MTDGTDSPRYKWVKENIEARFDELSSLLHRPAAMDTHVARSRARRQTATIFLCALAIVFVDMGCFLTSAPQLRLFESIVCRHYYKLQDPGKIDRYGQVPEHLCKINSVQDEIAFLDGYQMLFDNIPGAYDGKERCVSIVTANLP